MHQQRKESMMNALRQHQQSSAQSITCPYCHGPTIINPRADYRPIYTICNGCKEKFIIERVARGIKAFTLEEAPTCSDPNRRAIEMGQGDEE